MSKVVCAYCEELKPLTEFPIDKRNVTGFALDRCRACKAEFASETVKCDHCGSNVRKDCLQRHKKTLKCIEHEQDKPWKKFRSDGRKKVNCPCAICKARDYPVSEKTAYQHLKHGIVERPPSKRDQEKQKKSKASLKFEIDEQSDEEIDTKLKKKINGKGKK